MIRDIESDSGFFTDVSGNTQPEVQARPPDTAAVYRNGAAQEVALQGVWANHPKFGRQFQASSCIAKIPTTLVGIAKYLGSGMIKGIGKNFAQKLVDHFGQQIVEVIEKKPELLTQVPGIGAKRAEQIARSWADQKEVAAIMVFLQERDVSPAFAGKIFKTYGQRSIAIVQENPYRLADEIWGVGFKTADKLAHKIGISSGSPLRIKAGILYAISQVASQGHLYISRIDLKQQIGTILELEQFSIEELVETALDQLYMEEKIRFVADPVAGEMVTLSSYIFSEYAIATILKKLIACKPEHSFPVDEVYQALRVCKEGQGLVLNEDQQRGILVALQNKVTIITGGPGTGKTTLIRTLLGVLDEHKRVYKLAAPTGRAAKRMSEGTGRYAMTLHRLLEFDPAKNGFTKNEQDALKLDFLIIDEASMIDVFLARALLRALPLRAQIIFLGDVDQLPSVGAGNFLNDMISSNLVPSVRLTQIFRQAQDSLIIVNAHRINRGEFPLLSLPNARKDFFFLKEDDPAKAMMHIEKLYTQLLPRYHIRSEDATVLVPMNRGVVGAWQLNHALQNFLNPFSGGPQLQAMATSFRVGDRVMQLVNNYDKSVFNGDTGIVEGMHVEDRQLSVRFGERLVVYEPEELLELTLAYAISIHKSQGSEYSAVIIPLFMQHFMLLQRNLIYTGITRAKKLCIFIGQPKALAIGIRNNQGKKRITFLKQFLNGELPTT